MVDNDFEEGEIEGLVHDALQAKVGSCIATRRVRPERTGEIDYGACKTAVVQVELPPEAISQAPSSKRHKKQKKKEQGNGSSTAYVDVYGQQVSTYSSWC